MYLLSASAVVHDAGFRVRIPHEAKVIGSLDMHIQVFQNILEFSAILVLSQVERIFALQGDPQDDSECPPPATLTHFPSLVATLKICNME
jgi:hypothetical protein